MTAVSVVIPAFNSAEYIGAAIQSVVDQTERPSEILVIDDGSTDDTRNVVQRYPVRYIHQPNAGPSAARNTGISKATGQFVAFLDADDVWLPHKLAAQMSAFDDYPDAGFSFSTVWNLYAGSNSKISQAPYYPPQLVRWMQEAGVKGGAVCGSVYKLLLHKNCVATSSMVVRRDLIERVGLFDLNLRIAEDYDYWIRLARLAPAVFIEQPVSRYRIVDDGLSGAWNARHERFYDTAVQVVGAHMKAHPSVITRSAMGAALADYAFYCLAMGRLSEARRLSFRGLRMYPTCKGLKTLCEALLPRAVSVISQIAHLRRSEPR